MLIGNLYQRLLVAAGAVALLVVNWFCRPARRHPLPILQDQATEGGTEHEALLTEAGSANEELKKDDNGLVDAASYEAPELSQPGTEQQLRDDAPVAPEDVVMDSMHVSEAAPPAPGMHSTELGAASGSRRGAQPSSAAAAAPATAQPAAPVKPGTANPVDEDYLKSLLDQEFGPPKFAVRKQAPAPAEPQPAGTNQSLQELLDQAFGPPKFAVPKPTSPPPGAEQDAGAAAEAEVMLGTAVAMKVAEAGPGAPRGPGQGAGVKRSAQEHDAADLAAGDFMVLTLNVTHGPAAGKRFVADDPTVEYKIGRLPESSLQILDQEISGRHASVRWDSLSHQWLLHDVGSLNGTSLGGEAIGREYKVPGDEHALAPGATVLLGSVSQLLVELSPPAELPATAKRHHADSDAVSDLAAGLLVDRSHGDSASSLQRLTTPAATFDYPELGVRLCVHNRVGVDHKRLNQGCEDVPFWELPFEPYKGAGIICVFDGHHGSKAAEQAKEHLPAVLRAKLLLRDGREHPPLPPPPPPGARKAEEAEELEEEGYNDGSSDDDAEHAGTEPSPSSRSEEPGAAKPVEEGSEGSAAAAAPAEGETEAATDDGAGDVAEPAAPLELLPPPPEGPPLPPLLRGRGMSSQQAVLKDVFLTVDKYTSMEEGCTATVVMMDVDLEQGGWTLQSANVGDSSALLVNFTRGTWCKLSEDHRISSSVSERERLALRGHSVRTRLYGLNISRMLGDRFLKEEDLGFLAEPYVGTAVQVAPGDTAMLVVASDGLWDVLPEERAAKLLLQEASKSSSTFRPASAASAQNHNHYGTVVAGTQPAAVSRSASGRRLAHVDPSPLGCQAVTDLLLMQALTHRSKDDITVTVVEMGPHLSRRPQPPLQSAPTEPDGK